MINLICLHGFMGSKSDWDFLNGELDDVNIHSLDLPGHGLSNSVINKSDFFQELETYLNSIEGKKVLLGYSLGGRLALEFSKIYKLDGLILESAHFGLKNESEKHKRLEEDKKLAKKLSSIKTEPEFSKYLDAWYELELFGDLKTHSSYPELFKRRLSNSPTKLADALLAFSPSIQNSTVSDIENLKIPWAYLAGSKDERYAKQAKELVGQNQKNIHIIKDCSHNIHVENTDTYMTIINSYLVEYFQ